MYWLVAIVTILPDTGAVEAAAGNKDVFVHCPQTFPLPIIIITTPNNTTKPLMAFRHEDASLLLLCCDDRIINWKSSGRRDQGPHNILS
jgi:hypothetical protein